MGYTSTPLDWYVAAAIIVFLLLPVAVNAFVQGVDSKSDQSKGGFFYLLNFIGLVLSVSFYRVFAKLKYPKKKKSALALSRGEPCRVITRQKAVGIALLIMVITNLLFYRVTQLIDNRIRCSKGGTVEYVIGSNPECPPGYKLRR